MSGKKPKDVTSEEDFPSLSGSTSNSNTIGKWGTKKAWGASGKVVFVGEPVKEAEVPKGEFASATTGDNPTDIQTSPETVREIESTLEVTEKPLVSPSQVFPEVFSQPLSTDPTVTDANVSPYVGLRLLSSSSKNESPTFNSGTPWNFSATPFVPSVSSSSSSSLLPDPSNQKPESPIGDPSTEGAQHTPSDEVSEPSEPFPPLSNTPRPTASIAPSNPMEIPSENDKASPSLDAQPVAQPLPTNIFGTDDFPSLSDAPVAHMKPVVWSAESSRNVQAPAPVASLFEVTDWNCVEVGAFRERGKKRMAGIVKTHENTVKVITNSHTVNFISMEVFTYDVIIFKFHTPKGKTTPRRVRINGGKGSDRKRQTQCVQIMDVVLRKFCQIDKFVYDGAFLIYVPQAIEEKMIRQNIIVESTNKIWPEDIRRDWFAETGGRFEIELKLKGSFFTNEIMKEVVTNNGADSNKVKTMLQIALTTEPRRGGFLVSDKSDIYPPQEAETSYNGETPVKLSRSGISLSVTIAEGHDRKGTVQLTIAHQLTNFYPVGRIVLYQKLLGLDFTILEDCQKALKFLRVYPIYSNRIMEIKGFSDCPVSQLEKITRVNSETNKKTTTTVLEVAKKLASGFGVDSYNSNLYAVKAVIQSRDKKEPGSKKHFHLLENLKCCPDQKMPALVADAPPAPKISDRVRETKNVAEAAKILTPNANLEGFQISIDPHPIAVAAVRIEPPQICYSGQTKHVDVSRGSWKPGKPIRPATIKSVLILYRQEPGQGRRVIEQIEKFKQFLATQSTLLAQKIPLNAITMEDLSLHRGMPEDVLERRILELKRKNENPYVFYADGIKNSHGYVKLIERQTGILIEHLDVAESLKRMSESTCKSIILKMNIRSRGLNHVAKVSDTSLRDIWGPDSNTLIISYDVCYCAGAKTLKAGEPTTEPSTIGFGFNGTSNPEVFIGDFHYQNPRQEKVNGPILQSKTIWMMDKFTRARGKTPRKIIIVRDGVSDAQYNMAQKEELEQIVIGVEKYLKVVMNGKRKVQITTKAGDVQISMFIITKRQSHRFYTQDPNGVIQNVPPMTAISDVILRKAEALEGQPESSPFEIIFIPHKPIDGTAAPHLITRLYNEVFDSFDQLMKFMAALCCANQASTCIGSLPDCLVAADAYAKRGAELFEAYTKQMKKQARQLPTMPYSTEGVDTDWDRVSAELCYESSQKFQNLRLA